MFLASVSSDLKVYDYEHWEYQFSYGNSEGQMRNVQWSDDGKYLLQVNSNGTVEILSVTNDVGVRSLQFVREDGSCAASFHRGGHRQVAVANKSGRLIIWDTKFKKVLKVFPNTPSTVKLLDFNVKNTFLATALENGQTILYGVTTNNQVGNIKVPHSKRVSALNFHYEHRSLLGIATEEGSILLHDLATMKNKWFLRDAHYSLVSGIVFSPVNDSVLISCSYDKVVNLYDMRNLSTAHSVQTECVLTCVDMNSENCIALGSKKGEVLIYDLRNFIKPMKTFTEHKSLISRVAFQPSVSKTRFLAIDSSLRETISPKCQFAAQNPKTSESIRSFDFIEQLNSPNDISPTKDTEVLNSSQDSFLVNVIGDCNKTFPGRNSDCFSKESTNILKRKSVSQSAVIKLKSASNLPDPNIIETPPSGRALASTPILGKVLNIDNASPSPISKLLHDKNGNSSNAAYIDSGKENSPESISGAETVHGVVKNVTELSTESKDFIRYIMYDVLEECKNNYLHMTLEQTKNKISLEDQIGVLSQKMQCLQQTQNVLIEENRKLLIEVEMLRMARK